MSGLKRIIAGPSADHQPAQFLVKSSAVSACAGSAAIASAASAADAFKTQPSTLSVLLALCAALRDFLSAAQGPRVHTELRRIATALPLDGRRRCEHDSHRNEACDGISRQCKRMSADVKCAIAAAVYAVRYSVRRSAPNEVWHCTHPTEVLCIRDGT